MSANGKKPGDDRVSAPKAIAREVAQKVAERAIVDIVDGRTPRELQAHLHDGHSTEVLYLEAEVAYLTDPKFRPISFFYSLMRGTVTFHDFRAKATDGRWEANREKIKAQAKAELVRRVSSQIVKDQVEEAEQVAQLRRWLLELLTPARDEDGRLTFQVAPRSLEGCIKVFKEVSILLQMYRQTVLQQIEPHAPQIVDDDQVAKGPFTDEEAGQIAEQLMRKRFLKP